ncbi:N-alpha-acetyltransferase 40 [Strongyloides ratti]|uniref:N-alpha-acetyltransferase 40 n=1 Tax=Strongyloides ratti TaxID=34506 RepID=A0A090LGU6_STRRB|nr:N-alpha-acetyltransferase 40 [Strongyloides ratti]CEF69026.1 N-alpha-acetyltransferase 40 [Strongyloides ratti]
MGKAKASEVYKKICKKAGKLKNPVSSANAIPEKPMTICNKEIELLFPWATHLSDEDTEWVFDLFKRNMFGMYQMSIDGWNETQKRQELFATTSRYVIAKVEGKNCGYVHYRFDIDGGLPVLYLYEIQIETNMQNKGLGGLLLSMLEKTAKNLDMKKVVCTVFAFNSQSLAFFHKNNYTTDETCPGADDGVDYLILSKKFE